MNPQKVVLPKPLFADPDLQSYIGPQHSFSVFPPGIDRLSNVFVSHYGLVSKFGVLNRHCMPNLFPENDIPQFWNFQKEVAFQEAVCRFGSSLKVRKLDPEHTYLLIHHKWFGYSFWLTCFMPRLLRALDAGLVAKNTKLLVSNRWNNFEYVASSLASVGIEWECLELDEHAFISRLILPHARKSSSLFHPNEICRVAQHYTQAFSNTPKAPTRKIWIHRSEKSRRALLNEGEVLRLIQNLGFEPIVFEELPMKKQIQLMQETKILAGLHGAGLTNLIFLPKGATVLEFMPEDFAAYGHPFTFRNLASVASIQYAVSGMETHAKKTKWTPPQKTGAEVRLKIINADRRLDLNKLKRALQCVLD
jgi:hypothetical protein